MTLSSPPPDDAHLIEDAPLDAVNAPKESPVVGTVVSNNDTDIADSDDILGKDEDWAAHNAKKEKADSDFWDAEKVAPPKVEEELEPAVLKGEIEALLFMTSRPLPMEELALMLEASLDDVSEAMVDLIGDYQFREDSSLEIDDSEEGYILQVRKNYTHLVNKMLPMELSTASLRTLSVIAIKAPMIQKELIDLRGSSAYDHVKELLAHKLISKNRSGSSYRINVTSTFHQMFKLTGDKKDLDILVESELSAERMKRDAIMARPVEAIAPLEELSLSVELD